MGERISIPEQLRRHLSNTPSYKVTDGSLIFKEISVGYLVVTVVYFLM